MIVGKHRRGVPEMIYDVLKFIGNRRVGRESVYRNCAVNCVFFTSQVMGKGFVELVEGKNNYGALVSLTCRGFEYVKRFESCLELLR